ncbi:transcriptional regulator [Agromyces sp. MMS17-SY077]|uniref:Transcriptional regulator n=2 Tax=Agromyces seonyuensis TaxID=2662446 RepID=A0A6I4NUS5_9MICO|nr:helix-turn-helix domain-containing protein [Agromyces seonyuensis]MWB98206.1 transcriptional regulator [Agromyces seonyuensis]
MHIDDEACRRFQSSVETVGRRWSSGILLALARGANRFSEIVAAVDGLSDRMAAVRLRELEAAALVIRTVVPTTPVQVRYALTPRGRSLMAAMTPLVRWGIEDAETDAAGFEEDERRTA